MSLRAVNLNLLPILRALLREQSVTGAAASLGMSHSRVSDALGTLRAVLKDPLLVRVGGQMKLTPRAVDLSDSVETLCSGLDAFFSRQDFDPSTATRTFVIAASDHAVFLMASALLAAIKAAAPRIKIRFVEIDEHLAEQLAAKEVDFALLPPFFVDDSGPEPLQFRPLLRDVDVAMFRKGHPLSARQAISSSDISRFRLIVFHPGSKSIELQRDGDCTSGDSRDVAVFLPQITVAPYLLSGTDYVALVPQSLASRMSTPLGLDWRPLSYETQNVHMGIAWSAVQEIDPAHRWFRELVEARFAERSDR